MFQSQIIVLAELIYYLSYFDTVINYCEQDMFTDYEHLLTGKERLELISLVTLFNPKMFIDTGILY